MSAPSSGPGKPRSPRQLAQPAEARRKIRGRGFTPARQAALAQVQAGNRGRRLNEKQRATVLANFQRANVGGLTPARQKHLARLQAAPRTEKQLATLDVAREASLARGFTPARQENLRKAQKASAAQPRSEEQKASLARTWTQPRTEKQLAHLPQARESSNARGFTPARQAAWEKTRKAGNAVGATPARRAAMAHASQVLLERGFTQAHREKLDKARRETSRKRRGALVKREGLTERQVEVLSRPMSPDTLEALRREAPEGACIVCWRPRAPRVPFTCTNPREGSTTKVCYEYVRRLQRFGFATLPPRVRKEPRRPRKAAPETPTLVPLPSPSLPGLTPRQVEVLSRPVDVGSLVRLQREARRGQCLVCHRAAKGRELACERRRRGTRERTCRHALRALRSQVAALLEGSPAQLAPGQLREDTSNGQGAWQ